MLLDKTMHITFFSFRKIIGTLVLFVSTSALLLLPDCALLWGGYGVTSIYHADTYVIISTMSAVITLLKWRWCRYVTLLLIVIAQTIWISSLIYFGSTLRPEQIMLSMQDSKDAYIGFLEFVPYLAHILIPMCGLYFALCFINSKMPRIQSLHLPGVGVLSLALSVCGVVYLLVGPSQRALYDFPGLQSASAFATFRATIVAAKYSMFSHRRLPQGLESQSPVISSLNIDNEDGPVTVVVIMGESINPARLSLFGAQPDTTPNLRTWRKTPPNGLTMLGRIGFSAGVATQASVPSFLKPTVIPLGGESRGPNLFDLARKGGFKTWFFSAQEPKLIAPAGGAPGAEKAVGVDSMTSEYNRVQDAYLVDLAKGVTTKDNNRAFIFFHQRAPHVPYLESCRHVDDDFKYLLDGNLSYDEQRKSEYFIGLRCWDRNVSDIVNLLSLRPGSLYIFVTADHSELMGEDGLFGHSHFVLRNSTVPFILLTNRPMSKVTDAFRNMEPTSFFNLSRVVALALGARIEEGDNIHGRFFVGGTLPFGADGYMQALETAPWEFRVDLLNPEGILLGQKAVTLRDLSFGSLFVSEATQNQALLKK